MPNLQFIIDHKDYIKNIARKLGILEDIKLTRYNSDELVLVIKYDEKLSTDELDYSRRRSMFQMWLIYKFESSFFVVSEKAGIWEELVRNSVSINENEKLVEYFRKELKNIEFNDAYVEDEDDLKYKLPEIIKLIGESLANYDPKKNIEIKANNYPSFFSDSKSDHATKQRDLDNFSMILLILRGSIKNWLASKSYHEQLVRLEKALEDSLNPQAESFKYLPNDIKKSITDRILFPIPASMSESKFFESIQETITSAMYEYIQSREEHIFSLDKFCKEKISEWLNVDSANILILENALKDSFQMSSESFLLLPELFKPRLRYPNISATGRIVISLSDAIDVIKEAIAITIKKYKEEGGEIKSQLRP
jgi:hypothetical protein